MKAKILKVVVFPDYGIPYQRRLYDTLLAEKPGMLELARLRAPTRGGLLVIPMRLFRLRLQGYSVFHVHFPAFATRWIPFRRRIGVWWYRALLAWARLLGYRIVWTVHNVLPHEPETANDLAVARRLSRAASSIIVHSSQTIAEMNALGMATGRTVVIRHGSLAGFYGQPVEKPAARHALGIRDDAFVILAFGMIRPYKGIDELLGVVRTWTDQDLVLIVAGACADDGLRRSLETAAADDARIMLRLGHIADESVATLFGACDVVCAPFRAITTSSSVVLALSYGRPIVAPRIGDLVELSANVGYLYNADGPDELRRALAEARSDGRINERSTAALVHAESLTWPGIAAATRRVYETANQS